MSTIASLISLLGDTGIKPYNEQELTANRIQFGNTQNQTQLLELAELRRQQETAAQARAYFAANPDALLGGGGGSVLGALGPAGGPPGGGPLLQQTTMPGQPPGAPQVVPGGQDLSQFATPGGPPTSVLGALGPQPQAGAPPLEQLMRQNPDAAFQVMQRSQQQEGVRMQREEQRLTMGTKVMEYVGRVAQGVTDQASLDAARQELARVHPQVVAQLPQGYSKEALAPFIAKALDVKESLTLQVQDLTAQAAVIRARKEGRATDVDNQLRGMGVQPGQETPEQMREALRLVQEGKKEISASHGTGQIVMTPGGAIRVGKDNQVEVIKGPDGQPIYDKPTAAAEGAASYGDRAKRAHDNAVALEKKGLTPSLWSKVGDALPLGLGNYLVGEDQRSYRQAVNQFAGALLRKESGAAISQTEYDMTDKTFFPQPNDSKNQIEAKRLEREAVIKNLQEEGKGAGRTGTQAKPQDQSSAGTAKPVSEMSAEETRAEIAAIKARGGR